MSIRSRLRNDFIAGLLVTLPISVTVFILMFSFVKLDNVLGPYITLLLIKLHVPVPPNLRIYGLGVVFTVLFVFLIGLFTKNFFGKKIVHLGESIVHQIPVMRSIYSAAKQVVEAFASANSMSFNQVVFIEFPRMGVYSVGFVTNESVPDPANKDHQDLAMVFIPTTPNPFNGFLIAAYKKDLIPLTMTVEEGVKIIISAGIVIPHTLETTEGKKITAFPVGNLLEKK